MAIEALALALERGDIHILNDPVLVSELVAYEAERLPSGLIRYRAPSGQHDDCVMALAIAWSAVCGQQSAVYAVTEADLVVPSFEIPAHWPRAYGLDVGWCTTAAIWGALDPASDVLYLVREYISNEQQLSVHAQAIASAGAWIRGVMDPVANGRNQMDGYRLMEMYQNVGLNLEAADNLVESGILEVSARISTGRLKVFASLNSYLQELCSYRRDERGQIVTECDSLQNATRSLVVSGITCMRTKPVKEPLEYRCGDVECAQYDRTDRAVYVFIAGGCMDLEPDRRVRVDPGFGRPSRCSCGSATISGPGCSEKPDGPAPGRSLRRITRNHSLLRANSQANLTWRFGDYTSIWDPQRVAGMLMSNPLDRMQRSVLAFSVTWPWEKSVMPDAQALIAGTKRNLSISLPSCTPKRSSTS